MLDSYDKARLDGFTGTRQEFEKHEFLLKGVDVTKSYATDTEQKMTTNQPSTTAAKALIDMIRGEQGPQGPQGERGEPGLDLYQLAVLSGFKGSFYQFMSSLKGENGDSIVGPMGPKGEQGPKGDKGERGADGRDGDIPNHQIEGGKVRFELPNGAWGEWVSVSTPTQTSQMGAGPLAIQKFYSGVANFPAAGKTQILYFDTSVAPHTLYIWDGSQYQSVGGSGAAVTGVDSWIYYAAHWSTYPTSQGTIAAGEVFAYELNGTTRYRLVPSPYVPENDAFYGTFNAGVLGTLLVARTWADSVGGVSDHGLLTGLTDDDHPQYHNDARGDLRYQPLAAVLTNTTASFTLADEAAIDGLATTYQPLNAILTATTASFTTADETKLDALAVMTGATALVAGVTGTVPAPIAGEHEKYLKGDGTWSTIPGVTPTALAYGRVKANTTLTSTAFSITAPGTKVPFNSTVYSSGVTVSGTDSFIPTTTGRYRATWFMLAGSGDFNDDGTFHVVQGGVSLGSVFVDMMQAAGVNQVSSSIDVDVVAGSAVELRYQPASADSIPWGAGSYYQLEQISGQLPSQVFAGATIGAAGSIGLVPAPAAGEQGKFLTGAGTWQAQLTGVTAHVDLTGLADDDHLQYHTDARGDARYAALVHNHTGTYQPLDPVLTATTASFTTADETKLDGLVNSVAMTGATAVLPGVSGLVPTPAAGDEAKVLSGAGTWVAVTADHGALTGLADDDHTQYHNDARGDARYAVAMTGATAVANGTTGRIPAPVAGDDVKFLRGDATWATVSTTDRRATPILRANATAGVAPTVGEHASPIAGDAAIVILNDGKVEYYQYTTVWGLITTVSPVTFDGSHTPISRADSITNVPPTVIEVPSPVEGDSASVFLNDGTIENWYRNATVWALINTITPVTSDGNSTWIPRANATASVAPTVGEVAAPVSGDTAIVLLNSGTKEYWTYTTVWALTATDSPAGVTTLTQVQVEDSASVVEGTVTGQRLAQTVAANEVGIKHAYIDSVARVAETGYTITTVDIAKKRIFQQQSDNTLWTPTGTAGAVTWVQIGGVSDHGALTGLADDDHTQYHTDARGDARYSLLAHNHTGTYQPLATVLTNTTASFTTADETKLDALAVMVGSTTGTAGVTGTVPAPAAGSNLRYLQANGVWAALPAPVYGSVTLAANLDVNASATVWVTRNGLSLTLPSAGTYRVFWSVSGEVADAGTLELALSGRLINVSTATVYTQSAHVISGYDSPTASVSTRFGNGCGEAIIVITGSNTIRLQTRISAIATGGAIIMGDSYERGTSYMSYVKLD